MIRTLREQFNESWTPEQYDALIERLQNRTHGSVQFPIAETPCFLPRELLDRLAATGSELIRQAMSGEAGEAAARVVPDRFRGALPSEPHPTLLQVDFGLVRDADGGFAPRLVELQAFPSLYGFQVALAEAFRHAFTMPLGLDDYMGDLTPESYRELLRHTLLGSHDPAE